MLTILTQTITIYPTESAAAALIAGFLAEDDDGTDYRVVANETGFYVAIFEDGAQVFTL